MPLSFTTPLPRKRRWRLIGFFVLAHLIGFFSSIDALMSSRTSQGTVAWIVSLNTVPYLSAPIYWVFGRDRFQGYVIARRDEDTALAISMLDKTTELWTHRYNGARHNKQLHGIEQLAKWPFLNGNKVSLLKNGEQTFDSIFAGIAAAERYLLVQFYLVNADDLGQRLREALIAKVEEGLDVYFLYDEIGSYGLPSSYLQSLRDGGVQVHRFHSTRGPGNRFQLNFRNHRKIVVADGMRAWVGGLNVGDEYLGKDPRIGRWRDTHLKIEGPAALALQMTFLEDWHWATDTIPELDWQPAYHHDADVPVLILPSGPADRFETASLMMQQSIHAAQQRIWIASPYFVPDEGVQGMLKLAAVSGVDVRILIPEVPDNPLLFYAAYAFIEPLLEAGVKVYRYQDGFLHGKAFLVDDRGAAVGTVNLDNRSFRLNFEVTAIVLDQQFAREVEAMFEEDFARSRQMVLDDIRQLTFWHRLASRAAYLFAPVL
ncbi:MAG: cardiolipin synthase [Gammaproteobacteria bacterium]|nr:cardiolipin synthase [Gammaproteobacteria bacterium]